MYFICSDLSQAIYFKESLPGLWTFGGVHLRKGRMVCKLVKINVFSLEIDKDYRSDIDKMIQDESILFEAT